VAFTQPHLLEAPPAPQVSGAEHFPQSTDWPQLLTVGPQSLPAHAAALFGVQPQTFATPLPPQIWPAGHTPHWRTALQPSDSTPQFLPVSGHVTGVHELEPQTFGPAPPQVSPGVQSGFPAGFVEQFATPPQPSGRTPQSLPPTPQVTGAQAPASGGTGVHRLPLQISLRSQSRSVLH